MFGAPKFKKIDKILYKGFEIPIYSDGKIKYAGHPFIEGEHKSQNTIYDVSDISKLKDAIYMGSKVDDMNQEDLFPKSIGTIRIAKPKKENFILKSIVKEEIHKYILNEINDEEIEYEVIPLGDFFEYGQYKSDEVLNKIKGLRVKTNEILKERPDSSFTFNIDAGESKVTNPKGFEVPGSLALARAKEVEGYINQSFGDLRNKVTINCPENIKDIKIGQTPYRPGKGDHLNVKLAPLYKKEQFVNLTFMPKSTITKIDVIPEVCNFKAVPEKGLVADPEKDFLFKKYIQDISKIKNGQKINVILSPHIVADLLYVKAGNKEFNTGFVGDKNGYYSIMLATILYYTYTRQGKPIPKKFPNDIVEFPMETAITSFQNDSGLEELLGHVIKIGWKKNPIKNVKNIEWKKFTKNPIIETGRNLIGHVGGVVEIVKDDTMKSLEIEVYSPIGTTIWDLQVICGDMKKK